MKYFTLKAEKRADDAESACKRLLKENEKCEGKVGGASQENLTDYHNA